jgi:CheY-like chemotaxis protein
MGLAIVRRLCQLLGHPLQVRSVPGGGSVFRVVVPTALGGAPEAAVLGADTLPPRIAQQATVLLIDDEQAIRDAMAALLRPHRIELIAAASTADAVAMAEQSDGRIDLILSDWRLRGDDDGIRAVREVRRVCGESTPAVLITGDTSPALLKFAHEKGLVVMHKPLQPRELLLLIERLVH